MKFNKDNLFISFTDESMKEYLFENPIEYNVELMHFCLPEVLSDWKSVVQQVKKVFRRYPVRRHVHGPFMDLNYNSRDQDIRELARQKMQLGLTIAGEIGAEHIVFHSSYNPLVVDPRYPKVWLHRSTKFWSDLVPHAERNNCVMVFENVFDERPDMMKKLIKAVNSRFFKACLDVGHAYIFGKIPLEEWVRSLGKDLVHIHLHDNSKIYDEHLGLGQGNINWKKFLSCVNKRRPVPSFTLEVKDEKEFQVSLAYLKKNGLWEETLITANKKRE